MVVVKDGRRQVSVAVVHLAVDHDATTEPGADEQTDHRARAAAGAEGGFAVGAGVAIVGREAGPTEQPRRGRAEWNLLPTEVRRPHRRAVRQHRARRAETHRLELAQLDAGLGARLAHHRFEARDHRLEALVLADLLARPAEDPPLLVGHERVELGAADVYPSQSQRFVLVHPALRSIVWRRLRDARARARALRSSDVLARFAR
jgi:hypothetical protein